MEASAGTRPSASSTTQPQRRANVESGPPKTAWISAEAFLQSVASSGSAIRKNGHLDRTVGGSRAHFVASAENRLPPLPSQTRAVRYNPGPTFKKARGRKKKALLDPSEVTKDRLIGAKELTALLGDLNLQQVRLGRVFLLPGRRWHFPTLCTQAIFTRKVVSGSIGAIKECWYCIKN